MYQASVRSATAGTAKTFLAIVAILSLLLSFFATAQPTLAQGEGEADCPEGTTYIANFGQGDLYVGLELADGVTISDIQYVTEGGEVAAVKVTNASDYVYAIAVKGGSDTTGNYVYVQPGTTSDWISVTDNPTISNLSVCQGELVEETPTLTVAKETVGGDSDFQLTLDGSNAALLSDGESEQVAAMAGEYDLAEVLSQAQIDAGWSLTSIECTGNATAEVVAGASVTVTVGADEDVLCTFTNRLADQGEAEGVLEIDKLECLAADSGTVISPPEYLEPTFGAMNEGTEDEGFSQIGDCRLPDGVVFEVYVDIDGDDALNGELETDPVATLTTENGVVNHTLPVGEYLLVEPGTDAWPGGWVAFDIVEGSWTIIDVRNEIGVLGSLLIAKQDAAGEPLGGAGFTIGEMDEVLDNGVGDLDERAGFVCVDGLTLGDPYQIVESTVPDGYAGDEPQTIDVTVDADCGDRDEEDGVDATFVNTALPTGSVKVLKYFCGIEAPAEFDNPHFIVLNGEDTEDPTLPGGFGEECSRGGENPEASFTLDGRSGSTTNGILIFGGVALGSYTLSETSPMTGSTDEDAIVLDDAGDITTVVVLNFEAGQAGTGSITIQKDFEEGECPACETRTPGYWFNRGGGGGVDDANAMLPTFDAELITFPIGQGGSTTFDTVAKVHAYLDWDRSGGDGENGLSGTGQLLRHYLALLLNVNATDCPWDEVMYGDMSVTEWLDAAWDVLSEGGEDEEIKDALDAINNADHGDGTLECTDAAADASLAGFTFEIALEGGDPEDWPQSMTTGATGMVTFDNLPFGTYTVEEVAPEGQDCTIVSVNGQEPNEDGTFTVVLSETTPDVTVTVVNACEGEGGNEGELGSITVLKNAVPDAAQDFAFTTTGLSPATFSLDDDADATLSNQLVFGSLDEGTYSVTESAVTGWTLTSISCLPAAAATVDGAQVTIELDAGEHVTCTFVNTQQGQEAQTGSITVLKNAVPDAAQDFAFTTTGGLTPATFSLDDDADATLSNQQTFTGLAAGTYSVTEASTTGWTTTLSCSPSAGVSISGSTATIDLAAGANVTCTFVNTQQGSGVLPGNPTQTGGGVSPTRSGTLGGTLPNTALGSDEPISLPAAALALLALAGLAGAGRFAVAEARRRR